jgi:hypothetical protein
MEKYVQGFTYKTLTAIDGKPAIQFSIPETDDTKKVAGTYNIILNSETNSLLSGLPQNTGQYIYGSLLRGKTVKSDPIMSASGFNYEIVPDNTDGDPRTAHLILNYDVVVNKKDQSGVLKNMVESRKKEVTFNLKDGENRKSPDEIVQMLISLYTQQMADNSNARKEYDAYLKSHLGGSSTTMGGQVGAPAPNVVNKSDMMRQLGL